MGIAPSHCTGVSLQLKRVDCAAFNIRTSPSYLSLAEVTVLSLPLRCFLADVLSDFMTLVCIILF